MLNCARWQQNGLWQLQVMEGNRGGQADSEAAPVTLELNAVAVLQKDQTHKTNKQKRHGA